MGMIAKYIPGYGCECEARCPCECGCGVDWTPTRQKQLEAEVLEQARLLGMSAEREANLIAQLAAERALADRLATALKNLWRSDTLRGAHCEIIEAALEPWKEARNE